MYRSIAIFLVLLFATVSVAQSSRHHRTKKEAPTPPIVPTAKQSEEMKKLTDTFAGMWKTTATLEQGAMFPKSGTATGRSDFRSGPAGNSLIERARSHGALGLFAGMGVIWWDARAAVYKGIWCDSLAPEGCDSTGTGRWDGGNLVFTADIDMGQTKMHMRSAYSNITADAFTYTLETSMDDAPLAKAMTIQYERVQPRTTVVEPPQSGAADTNPKTE